MTPDFTATLKRHFRIVLVDGFSLLAFTSLVTPLKLANQLLGYRAYEWSVITGDGLPATSDCGVSVGADAGLAERSQPNDYVAIIAEYGAKPFRNREMIACIRGALAAGIPVAGIGGGALFLAEHGLLENRRCAVHWQVFPAILERYPSIKISHAYFEIDNLLHTCAGGAAAFDLALDGIRRDFDADTAERINRAALHRSPRTASDRQAVDVQQRGSRLGSPLHEVVTMMENNIGEPLTMQQLLASSPYSRRQIERLFDHHLGLSPKRYYLRVRIERAKSLLSYTSLSIVEISVATGFATHSHFTKTYRSLVGCAPQQTRAAALAEQSAAAGQPRRPPAAIAA